MNDLISRQAAIDAVHEEFDDCLVWDESGQRTADEFEIIINRLPSAQPTLYGYNIEHLAYIARVMEKEGVSAEYAVRTFDDMSRVLKMIIDESRQKVEETLNEWAERKEE